MPEPSRVCPICGSPVTDPRRTYCCPECAGKARVIRQREKSLNHGRHKETYRWLHCIDCGAYVYRPIKSKRCEACQEQARRRYAAESRQRQRLGKARTIGEVYQCERCRMPYILVGANQRYCSDCAKEAVAENVRTQSRERAREYLSTAEGKQRRAMARSGKSAPISIICANCGKPFETTKKNVRYCSDECRAVSYQKYHDAYEGTEERKARKRELYAARKAGQHEGCEMKGEEK